jgi:hypothetical protein
LLLLDLEGVEGISVSSVMTLLLLLLFLLEVVDSAVVSAEELALFLGSSEPKIFAFLAAAGTSALRLLAIIEWAGCAVD